MRSPWALLTPFSALGPPPARKPCLPLQRLRTLLSRSVFPQEFEIELEGSQCLRILCYEKCYDKTKVNKDNNEIVDKIMGKGQIQVRSRRGHGATAGGGARGEGVLLTGLLGQGAWPFVTRVQCWFGASPGRLAPPAGEDILL